MFILDSGCGWIPDAPIKFLYHIINLIKNLTPVVLIIMGSLDFGKAVMSQKEDEIKKAQGAFIKKLIAGAAVFFVIVFAKWAVNVVNNAGGDTGNALNCVSLLLNGSYSADNKSYYDGSNIPKKTTTKATTTTPKYSNFTDQEVFDILKECQNYSLTASNASVTCLDARDNFCNRMFSDSTCRGFCKTIDFSTANLANVFAGNHPTGKNGCKLDNIDSLLNQNTENKPQQNDELETCKPPSCECKYQDNKNKCDEQLNSNKNEELNSSACVKRLNTLINNVYCDCNTSELRAGINDNYSNFVHGYANSYNNNDPLYSWLDDSDAEQFFTYEGKFNCAQACSTASWSLTEICESRVYYDE